MFGSLISIVAINFINSLGQGVTARVDLQNLIIIFVMIFLMSILAAYIPIKKIELIDPVSVLK